MKQINNIIVHYHIKINFFSSCFNGSFNLPFQPIAFMMKVLWLFVSTLLLRHLDASAQASRNSSVPTIHPKPGDVDVRCDCTLTPNGFWDATCRLNGSLGSPSPFILFESL